MAQRWWESDYCKVLCMIQQLSYHNSPTSFDTIKNFNLFCAKIRPVHFIKYEYGIVLISLQNQFLTDSCDFVTHIIQGCLTGTGAIMWLPQCLWGNPERYGWNLLAPKHTTKQEPCTLKRKCHFDENVITGCTGSCHFDNFPFSLW